MQSPRRPIILKRRKLPFHKNEGDRLQNQSAHAPGTPTLPDGICIMNHPAMTDTQVVVIPKREDLQSVIGVLTAKGKERGSQGPNKFILLSGSNGSGNGVKPASLATSDSKNNLGPKACADGNTTPLLTGRLRNDPDRSLLDNSLTNIQWLGRMDTDVDGVQPPQNDSNKENINDNAQLQKPQQAEEEASSVKGSLSERPPYSYMAMIQFAINSKKNKMMTLKEIYNWIEDHFPYFRNVAKPGWKNSIRHNLSLHDLFIRESTSDGKISYWTIKPESNRCLTLDQVYKPIVDPATLSCTPQTKQVCVQQQQKRVPTEQKKVTSALPERKMKPLLPRTDSYLVPIQLPLAPSLFSAALTLPNPHQSSIASNPVSKTGCKRLCIAPKIMKTDSSSIVKLTSVPEMKEESLCMPITAESCSTKSKARSSSRRKQRLLPPSTEEPVLLYADTTSFDSGVASDISVFQEVEIKTESWHGPQLETEPFKTPIKGSHPASSTPSKVLEPWMITPLGEGSHSVLDFSPIRTPQRHENTCLSFSGTPFKDLPLFSSPCDLLTSCSHEAQTNPANRSLTEGLVLDTMNDSLSKILVDISFSCLEDDDLGIANLSWSQFIPELK